MVLCNILNQSSQAAISLTSSLKECGRKKYMHGENTSRIFLFFPFVSFDTISSCCLYIRGGETELNKPLIKGIPRYNEADCIPRRTYSTMRQTLKLSLVRSSTHTAIAS